jgi:hypothetical protein
MLLVSAIQRGSYPGPRTCSTNCLRFSTGSTPLSTAFLFATNAGTLFTPRRAASRSSASTLFSNSWLLSACRNEPQTLSHENRGELVTFHRLSYGGANQCLHSSSYRRISTLSCNRGRNRSLNLRDSRFIPPLNRSDHGIPVNQTFRYVSSGWADRFERQHLHLKLLESGCGDQ